MGNALASNLVATGWTVVGHDSAGPGRAPSGVRFAPAVADVARETDVVVWSLPDGEASERVARQIAGTSNRRATHVIDTSTIGVAAARAVAERLAEAGVGYVDAPVSGGRAGARARTLVVMVAGGEKACGHVEPVLVGLSDRRYRVGDRPGLAQALKLANNFLSATALAATSEAIAFGCSAGLEMETMLEVLAASSGRNGAVTDKFPSEVLTGRYASGFRNSLMRKDLRLYLEAAGAGSEIGFAAATVWERFAAEEPDVDFTRIYPHVASRVVDADG
jgi:3-hydroxyisobutyrate dehydrogenase-like beta-hydroxyacid dehydrogenase